jgi:hypothetical protein
MLNWIRNILYYITNITPPSSEPQEIFHEEWLRQELGDEYNEAESGEEG